MADVRFGIDASGGRTGADEFIRQIQRMEAAARQLQTIKTITGGSASGGVTQRARQLETETRALNTQVVASQSAAKAEEALNRQRLAQIRSGIAYLRVINDEHASYARRVDASLRYSKALGIEIDTRKLLVGVQHQMQRAQAASIQATTTEEIANRSLSRGLRGIRDDFRGLAAVLQILPGNMGLLAAQTARLVQGFVLLGPLVGILATAAGGFVALGVAGDRAGKIPDTLKGIWAGLKEVAARAGEASGATGILVGWLEKLQGLLPAPTTALQAAESRLAELQARAATSAGATTGGRGSSELARNAQLRANELGAAEAEVTRLRADEKRKLALELDKEAKSLRDIYLRLGQVLELEQKEGGETAQTIRIKRELNQEYLRATGQLEAIEKATRAAADATREATERTEAYRDALQSFRLAEEEAIRGEQQRALDMKVSNDLLEQEIEATKRGTEALQAFNVEKARTLEIERQRKSGTPISGAQSEALIREAERGASLQNEMRRVTDAQKQLARVADDVWANTIENIQRGFGDLFTRLVTDGKDAFDNLGDFVKDLFARVIGEIINTQIFGRLFGALSQAGSRVGGAASAGAAPIFGNTALSKSITDGIVAGFAKIGGLVGGIFGAGQTGANTGGTIGGFAATAVANIGAIIAGGFIGSKLIGALKLANDTKLEKIALAVGTALGSIVGGIAGAYFGQPGLGAAVGGFLVGSAAVGQAQVINQLRAGANIFEAPNRLQAINRGAQIGGPIGAIIGGLSYNKLDTNLELRTAATAALLPSLQGGTTAVEGAFGFLGAAGAGTGGDLKGGNIMRILRGVAALDNEIAAHLSETEIALVAAAQDIQTQRHSNVRDATKVFAKRAREVLEVIGVPDLTIRTLTKGKPDVIASQVTAFLDERKAIIDLIDELRNFGEEVTDSERALEEISRVFERIRLAAPDFGIALEDATELKAEAIRRVIEGFNDTISESILFLTDPASLAANQLAEAHDRRLREAEALGADLVQIERLTGLERQELLKQINDPLQGVIDALKFSVSGQSPLAALSAAESRFAEIEAGIRDNTGAFQRTDLATAAQTLITLGESLLGGPDFAAQRDTVLATLESFLLTMPGTASDTGQALSGLTLETARGNAANEQLLQQIADENVAMRAQIALLTSQLDRLLNQS